MTSQRQRSRICRIELLEERELLSITTGEFDAIRSQYADLNLTNYGDYNIIEITADGLSDTNIRAAITEAGNTTANDLIVVRTTETQNKITLSGSELAVNISTS
jgi:hypothetical protein